MTDEEIYELCQKTKKEKYCSRYTREYGCTSDRFPGSRCPMYKMGNSNNEWYDRCEKEGYRLGFLDGFKAAFNEIVKDASPRVCTIIFKDTEKDDRN